MEIELTAVNFLKEEFKKYVNWQTYAMSYRGLSQEDDIRQVEYYTTNHFLKALEKAEEMERQQILKAKQNDKVDIYSER